MLVIAPHICIFHIFLFYAKSQEMFAIDIQNIFLNELTNLMGSITCKTEALNPYA